MSVRLAPKASRIVKTLRHRIHLRRDRALASSQAELRDYCDLLTGRQLSPMALDLLTEMVKLQLVKHHPGATTP